MAGAYPMLLAMGAVMGERWLGSLPRWGRRTVAVGLLRGLRVHLGLCLRHRSAACIQRAAPRLRSRAQRRPARGDRLGRTGPHRRQIRDSLPPEQQAHLGITTGNYGEYGAIDILGRAYRLPVPIGTTNSEWLRGYPTPRQPRSSSSASERGRRQPISSPTAASPATTATPKASATKKASTTPTSLSAARRASLARTLEGDRLRLSASRVPPY